MLIALHTLRCPDGIPPQRHEAVRGSLSIGRGVECNWVLPDPERVLSKRHCSLALDDGWTVTDISRNGTFVNGQALDPGLPRKLSSGDRLTLGAYEIEVRLREEGEQADVTIGSEAAPRAQVEQRLTSDPFSPIGSDESTTARSSFDLFDPDSIVAGWNGPGRSFPDSPVSADRVSDLHGQFTPPRTSRELLPPDWDQHEDEQRKPQSEPLPFTPQEPTPPPPPNPPCPVGASDPPVVPADGFAAFALGAGLSGQPSADPQQALYELGAAFRAAVSGLRRTLIARAAIKGEFRIDQTIIQASGNNPLKFAADDDDALAALLGVGRRGGMSAERAVAEAMRDMRLHELAMAAAMPRAIRAMLTELAPAKVMRELAASAGDVIPGRRRQRAWDAFESLHARMLQDMDENFDGLVGRAFMRAYEAALIDLTEQAQDGSDSLPFSRGD